MSIAPQSAEAGRAAACCLLESAARLVGDDHGAAELVGQALQRAQEAAQAVLARRQLPAPDVLHAVQRGDAVDHDQREARVGHHGRGRDEQLALVVRVVRARVRHVVQHVVGVEPVPVREPRRSLGCTLGRTYTEFCGPLPTCARAGAVRTFRRSA